MPPPLTNSRSATSRTAATTSARRVRGPPPSALHQPHGGRGVGQAGDLGVVEHQARHDESPRRWAARATADGLRRACAAGSGARRGAGAPRAARRRRRGRPAGGAGARAPASRATCSALSIVRVICAAASAVAGQRRQRGPVDARVGDEDVVDAVGREPAAPRAPSRPSPRGSPAGSRARRSSARQRTDLEATRIGVPPARRTRSAAFASKASRSTTANGAARPAVARSQPAVTPPTVPRGRALARTSPLLHLAAARPWAAVPSVSAGGTPPRPRLRRIPT